MLLGSPLLVSGKGCTKEPLDCGECPFADACAMLELPVGYSSTTIDTPTPGTILFNSSESVKTSRGACSSCPVPEP